LPFALPVPRGSASAGRVGGGRPIAWKAGTSGRMHNVVEHPQFGAVHLR
jgi:hypothetical protein